MNTVSQLDPGILSQQSETKPTNLSGLWRLSEGSPIFLVQQDPGNPARFFFWRRDGDADSFHGHGLVQGGNLIISWRSTIGWLGHGSDESKEIEMDRITSKPIEIHWKGGMPTWQTLTN